MPSVTFVISAFNEADVIAEKIENTLTFDYPTQSVDIVVVSDCSDDGTDEIVRRYADCGVSLFRQDERLGKSAGLTRFMREATNTVTVFTDANTMYNPDALAKLVRHFGDASVGYVVGHQRYIDDTSTVSHAESLYWRYETWLKVQESRLSSVVGGDGAIYAIRSELFEPLLDDDISDFVLPLKIVTRGYRGVYDSEAICYEKTADDFGGEFRRKSRIVNRSLRAVLRAPQALNPFRVGWFAPQLFIHKVLRWLVPFLLLGMLLSSGALAATGDRLYLVALCGQVAFYLLALLRLTPLGRLKPIYVAYYFCLVNIASAKAVVEQLFGRTVATWTPERSAASETPRHIHSIRVAKAAPRTSWAWLLVPLATILLLVATVGSSHQAIQVIFVACMATGIYVLLGYPLVEYATTFFIRRTAPPEKTTWPAVSLLIPAYDEANSLAYALENHLATDYPAEKLEILVASDGSTDDTVEIARTFENQGVRVIDFEANRGKASVLNDAIKEATGEVICLCDANVMFRPDALRQLVARLDDPKVGAASGDVRLASHESTFGKGESFYYRLERWLQTGESTLGSMMGVDGGMYVLRRELVQPLPPDTILDDFVTSMRVIRQGKRIVYEPSAIASENGTPSTDAEFRRRVRVAAGAMQSIKRGEWPPWWRPIEAWQYVSHKLLRWLGPLWLLLLLTSNALLWNEGRFYQLLLVAQLLSYTLAALATLSMRFRSTRIGGIAFYFVMSHVAMGVGLCKGLLNLQSVTWGRTERKQSPTDTDETPQMPREAV